MSLKKVRIENYTNSKPLSLGKLDVLKNHQYQVESKYAITGDAPKEFIKVYEYGNGQRKDNRKTWSLYIAKTGHKWYPNESIMEYLLTRIGQVLELNIASARLVMAAGQVRYLSKYFLEPNQELVHGADIYAGFVADKDFVEQIENENKARDFFTIQFTKQALLDRFPNHATQLYEDFLKMLLFDAIVGNNDRHFYNWGIIRDLSGLKTPYFSPIYDTARGLFWNEPEQKIVSLHTDKNRFQNFLRKYIQNSMPKTGWEGQKNLNHFDLLKLLFIEHEDHNFKAILNVKKLHNCLEMIDKEFSFLFSLERKSLIKQCLQMRFEILINTIIT